MKKYYYIWNPHPRIFLIANFREKVKMPKFGTKNAIFGYFGARIHTWYQHPQNCLIANFCYGTEMPKFGTKNAFFVDFWVIILKNYCHIWNQHPRICQKWVFNSYSEFWYRVSFFYKSGICFFWRSGSGSGSTL